MTLAFRQMALRAKLFRFAVPILVSSGPSRTANSLVSSLAFLHNGSKSQPVMIHDTNRAFGPDSINDVERSNPRSVSPEVRP
jgi:hypothetical protein